MVENTCKSWTAAAKVKHENLWKAFYLLEWEAVSAADASVAIDGSETSWKKRFSQRARIDRNWLKKKSRVSTAASWARTLVVLSLPECKELPHRHWFHAVWDLC